MKEELNTLKDLIDYTEYDPVFGTINPNELKAEAVKWVKYYKDIPKIMIHHELVDSEVINFIKNFFNLTEEDLEGGKK